MPRRVTLARILAPKCSIPGCTGRAEGCIMCGKPALCIEHVERWKDCASCTFRMWERRTVPGVTDDLKKAPAVWVRPTRGRFQGWAFYGIFLNDRPSLMTMLWLNAHGFVEAPRNDGEEWCFYSYAPRTPDREGGGVTSS